MRSQSGMVRHQLPKQGHLVVMEMSLRILPDRLIQKVMDLLYLLGGQIFHPQMDLSDTLA